ncbi:HAF repeat-containing protein [Singulisphaera sp. Ch08]|uniref:HAF repeat-containing protein n=1 Tax=Singulisphaera sp. Ch08 TaxID=3120278 RepID=A0AAU7CP67_9BACT
MRHLCWLAIALMGLASSVQADEPAKPYQIITIKDDGIIATGINARGEVVGFEWLEEKERPGVLYQAPFYAKGKQLTYLPLLDGYTATFPAAVSDDGLVVGRVGKPAPPGVRVHFRNQAFVWEAARGIQGLGALKEDIASFACDVSSDGRRISGFSVGDNRIRACVWDRDGDRWQATAMPHETRLGSNVVAISDNGKYVTAVDGVVPCLWSQSPSGEWTREAIGEASSLVPRAVNNTATVVGVRFTGDGLTHAVRWNRDEGVKLLEKPKGYVRSEASAVNNNGLIVGMVDGPHGSKIGPNAFAYQNGQLHLINEGGPSFTAATCVNDRGQLAGVVEAEEEDQEPKTEGLPTKKPAP